MELKDVHQILDKEIEKERRRRMSEPFGHDKSTTALHIENRKRRLSDVHEDLFKLFAINTVSACQLHSSLYKGIYDRFLVSCVFSNRNEIKRDSGLVRYIESGNERERFIYLSRKWCCITQSVFSSDSGCPRLQMDTFNFDRSIYNIT